LGGKRPPSKPIKKLFGKRKGDKSRIGENALRSEEKGSKRSAANTTSIREGI